MVCIMLLFIIKYIESGIQSFCRVGGCHIVASSLVSLTEDEKLTCAGLMLLEKLSKKLDNEIVTQIMQENICPLLIKLISMHCTSEEIIHLGLSVLNNIGKNGIYILYIIIIYYFNRKYKK